MVQRKRLRTLACLLPRLRQELFDDTAARPQRRRSLKRFYRVFLLIGTEPRPAFVEMREENLCLRARSRARPPPGQGRRLPIDLHVKIFRSVKIRRLV